MALPWLGYNAPQKVCAACAAQHASVEQSAPAAKAKK